MTDEPITLNERYDRVSTALSQIGYVTFMVRSFCLQYGEPDPAKPLPTDTKITILKGHACKLEYDVKHAVGEIDGLIQALQDADQRKDQ